MSHLTDILKRQLQRSGVPEPLEEHAFHPTRRFRLDLCWPQYRVAVEVDGGVWAQGRHVRPQGYINDCEKYALAAVAGYRVLRFPGIWIADGGREVETAACYIRDVLAPYLEIDELAAEIERERPEWTPVEVTRYRDGVHELVYETETGAVVAIASRSEWQALRDAL